MNKPDTTDNIVSIDHEKSKRRKRSTDDGYALFVTDEELYARIGLSHTVGRPAVAMLDRDRRTGFPQKQALWGGRRYWPAVRAWLDKNNGLKMDPSPKESDDE